MNLKCSSTIARAAKRRHLRSVTSCCLVSVRASSVFRAPASAHTSRSKDAVSRDLADRCDGGVLDPSLDGDRIKTLPQILGAPEDLDSIPLPNFALEHIGS